MSIRLRLTLWYTIILAAVLILFGASLYYLLTFTLLNSIDRQLETAAQRLTASARVVPSFTLLGTLIDVPDLDILAGPGLYIQVYDSELKQIIRRSGTLGEASLPLEQPVLAAAMRGETQIETRPVGGSRLRICTAPIVIDGQVEGVVQVGTSLAQVEQTQRQLLAILAVGGVIAVAVSAGFGALLARVALRPIDVITQTALAISHTEDLSRRLEMVGPHDEVGRLAATFNEMLSRLEALFHTQRRFIADVSHELRTPLTAIQGNVDLLSRGAADDPEARQETVDTIQSEVARMSRLVSDLLLLAQADAGVKLKVEPVEVDTLLLDVYRQARLMANGVEVRLGHEDQAVVMGDPDRLRQLLLNLVDNAIKYTPAGGRVTLSLDRNDEWVCVSVADTGIGIPAEALEPGPEGLPQIFQRFYRVDKARSRAQGGTGLGLSIAHWIAKAHGGRIAVESVIGQGSRFTVWLPVHGDRVRGWVRPDPSHDHEALQDGELH
jgi:two-component system, OmpR family, sensor kinase